jgi:Zn-dependent peptidase ImmA (M78 family)/transcriptional regulator with XRE-family HTH domain
LIVGPRVRQARELRGLTQTELAHSIGVQQSSIAHLEAGLYSGSDLIAQIALVTGFPPTFFERDLVEEFPVGSLQFRGRVEMTRKSRAQAHRYAQLLFEIYTRLAARARVPSLAVPEIVNESPARAAELTRASLGLSPDTPIAHVINSLEKAGVAVLGLPVALTGREAFSGWADQRPFVALSAQAAGDRLRFTVAHELGHLVLHRAPKGAIPRIEAQAHAFAAEFLMPALQMRTVLVPPVTLSSLAPLKPIWRVSVQALARRARDLFIITSRQYYYLAEQIGRMGLRTDEGSGLAIPPEKPRALRQLLELLYGSPIDVRRAAADLKVSPRFMEEIVNAHAPASKRSQEARSTAVLRLHKSQPR